MDNVSVLVAFAGGLISFLSPCVLPLVPGYLSIISGVSLDQLKGEIQDRAVRRSVVINSILFIIGFSITFISLGASASWVGQLLLTRQRLFNRIAGAVIVIFGLHLLGVFKINALYQDKRFHGVQQRRGGFGALLLGLAFAFGWTPCIGPILAGIMAIASTKQTVFDGMFLLAIYSAGLAVPFLITSLGLNRFLQFYGRFKHHLRTVEMVSGGLVVVIGVMIFTNSMTRLNAYFSILSRLTIWLEHLIA